MGGNNLFRFRRHLRLCALLLACVTVLWPVRIYPDHLPGAGKMMPGRQAAPERILAMEVTAYCYTGHRTRTGTWPQRGTVAVDPRVIPLGTRLYVEGYGPAVAEDTGGTIQGNRVDLYLESRAAAREWGRRRVEVRVIP